MPSSNEVPLLNAAERQIEANAPAGSVFDDLSCVLEGMEPGLLVWDDDARCALYTERTIDILGMRSSDLSIGITRGQFLAASVERGELTDDDIETVERQFGRRNPFQFDRNLRSGHVVSTRARPLGERGFVVTFTDVSNERRKSQELDDTIRFADDARQQLAATLELETARQYEAGLLNEFGDWLQTCKSLEELYEVVKRFLEEMLPGSQGELYIYSNSRDVLDGVLSWGRTQIQDHIHPDSCWGLRRGRGYQFSSERICFECAHVATIKHLPIEAYTCIPIVAHGDTVGLLHIRYGGGAEVRGRAKNPTSFAAKCGELVSLAIANVRLRGELHEQSTRDVLTGLRNRRYCIDTLTTLKATFQRTGNPFAIISFDVDKFKEFNDNFGHDAGDAVLQRLADIMKDDLVEDQISCRFGGEEFLIVLPNTNGEIAADVAEELRVRVMNAEVWYAGKPLPTISISCGVSVYAEPSNTIQAVLKEADLALYRAKGNGRNRVEVATSMSLPPRPSGS